MRILILVALLAVGFAVWTGGLGRVAPASGGQPAAAAPAGPGDQTVQITEAELSQRLSQQMVGQPLGSTPLGQATLTHLTTRLVNGHLQADGDAQAGSTSVPVSLTATGTASDGKAIVLVDDLKAAGVPLPAGARESVQQAIQAQVDQAVDRLQLRVKSVSIGAGKLTLVGSPR